MTEEMNLYGKYLKAKKRAEQAEAYVEEYCQENKELAEKLRMAEVEAHDAQAELARWTRPHDSEDLQLLADQAKDSNSLAAQAAYINGLKTELAQARERIKELENIERQYPLDDRACAYGCGPCRWEPGPWHQRGCPSWRKEAGE